MWWWPTEQVSMHQLRHCPTSWCLEEKVTFPLIFSLVKSKGNIKPQMHANFITPLRCIQDIIPNWYRNVRGASMMSNELGCHFAMGTRCGLFTFQKKCGQSPKFWAFWKGPFKVLQKLSDANYGIRRGYGGGSQIVHFDCIKSYKAWPPPGSTLHSPAQTCHDSPVHPSVEDSFQSLNLSVETPMENTSMTCQVNEDDFWRMILPLKWVRLAHSKLPGMDGDAVNQFGWELEILNWNCGGKNIMVVGIKLKRYETTRSVQYLDWNQPGDLCLHYPY